MTSGDTVETKIFHHIKDTAGGAAKQIAAELSLPLEAVRSALYRHPENFVAYGSLPSRGKGRPQTLWRATTNDERDTYFKTRKPKPTPRPRAPRPPFTWVPA